MDARIPLLFTLLLGCLSHLVRSQGAAAPPPSGAPEDPRCVAVIDDSDTRPFTVVGLKVYTEGCYECSISGNDDGDYEGEFMPNIDMTGDLPVAYSLFKQAENQYAPIGAGPYTLKGLLDTFASVLANINCFLSQEMMVPLKKPEKPLVLKPCHIFERHFPVDFAAGKYLINLNQTSPKGEEFCGSMDIYFEIVK